MKMYPQLSRNPADEQEARIRQYDKDKIQASNKHATVYSTSSIFRIQFFMFSNDRSLVMSYTSIIPCSQ